MVAASVAMLAYVQQTLTAQVGDEAQLRARELADRPASIADGTSIDVSGAKEEFVQVLADGRVIASSTNVAGMPALASMRPGEEVVVDAVPFTDGPFVVHAVDAATPRGSRTVVVGLNIDDVIEARHVVTVALLIGVPVLLALVAALTWWLVGRTLRPVEDVRLEVERISSRELHRRVPVPAVDDEVSRLASTMNRMLERLERGQRRQRRFVSDASHELRSPVASIRQHAEVARQHPEGTDVAELAEVVLAEDERLQHLVEDLLLLARLDEHAEPAGVEVDLDDIVMMEAERLRAGTSAIVDMHEVGAGRVIGDRANLTRLVRNLMDNAARYAKARISVGLAELDGHVTLSVQDDGPGIPKEERDRAFERFVRLDDARSRGTGGAGVGLAIVREVAAAHGASVTATESALGGLRVDVRLPSADRTGR